MKKWSFLLILSLVVVLTSKPVNAQDVEGDNFWDKIYFGGNFNAQFGTLTFIDVSPLVGYRITERFSSGLGITYRYISNDFYNYSSSIYGGRVFAQHSIWRQFFAHAEYESLSTEFYSRNLDRVIRDWVPGLMIGGGLFQPLGKRAGFQIFALYNLLYDAQRSPYNDPWVIRVGFTI